MAIDKIVSGAASDGDALAAIVRHLKADSGTIHLVGGDGLLHLAAATPGFPDVVLQTIRTIPVGKGMAGLAVERRQPVDACNIQTDQSGDVRPGALATGLAGAIVVPIMRGDEAIGALGVANRAARTFSEAEIGELLAAGHALAARHAQGADATG
jgi:signal transduction protein with GAF and PtsI domain